MCVCVCVAGVKEFGYIYPNTRTRSNGRYFTGTQKALVLDCGCLVT